MYVLCAYNNAVLGHDEQPLSKLSEWNPNRQYPVGALLSGFRY